uniref:Uncharacterized protein n=3 Tax=Canis lupus TaxID=9612 RepID=A0A8I3MTY6_CANLF
MGDRLHSAAPGTPRSGQTGDAGETELKANAEKTSGSSIKIMKVEKQ